MDEQSTGIGVNDAGGRREEAPRHDALARRGAPRRRPCLGPGVGRPDPDDQVKSKWVTSVGLTQSMESSTQLQRCTRVVNLNHVSGNHA